MKPDDSGKVQIVANIQQLIADREIELHGCTHLSEIKDHVPSSEGCGKCLAMGNTWVNLRMCLICGHVGCCDASKNKHATKHFKETGHPMIVSFQPGEDWMWCYVDEVTISP